MLVKRAARQNPRSDRDLLDTERHQVVIRDAERLAEVAQDGDGE